MELKEFIKKIVGDTIEVVDEVSSSASRIVNLASRTDKRTVEFDVAVVVEEETKAGGKAGVKVFSLIDAGGDMSKGQKNVSTHRITFGVDVDSMTKNERTEQMAKIRRSNSERPDSI